MHTLHLGKHKVDVLLTQIKQMLKPLVEKSPFREEGDMNVSAPPQLSVFSFPAPRFIRGRILTPDDPTAHYSSSSSSSEKGSKLSQTNGEMQQDKQLQQTRAATLILTGSLTRF